MLLKNDKFFFLTFPFVFVFFFFLIEWYLLSFFKEMLVSCVQDEAVKHFTTLTYFHVGAGWGALLSEAWPPRRAC